MIRDGYNRFLRPLEHTETEVLLLCDGGPENNNVRPHCAHKYLTPAQVYFGDSIDLEKIKKQYDEAKKNRILENRKVICPMCST